ncbi:hypothetical protein DYB26_005112 [Aphanomyces astaci]|uniref:Peptidase M13 C-terminal domain-containing protein n=1 Tax=Aphanomyces astaci TaxID=112090 RepID=A0A418FFC6_APHAT|nr:hypothetical protein DYB26_005112 [Aphanomyces astaci]
MVKIIVAALSAGVASAFGTISEFPTELTSLMDQTVDPCTDFYSYSWGTWCNKTTLHANQSTIDVPTVLAAAADKVVEKLLNAKLPKLAEFYDSCMDTATLGTLGLAPIEVHLKAIRSTNSTSEAIFRGATISKATGVPMFVKLSVSPDAIETTRNVLSAKHSGFPFDRKYFHGSQWANIEEPYRNYIASIFRLAGHAEAEAEAATDVVIFFLRSSAGVVLSHRRLQSAGTSKNIQLSLSAANALYPRTVGPQLQAFGFDVREGSNTTTVVVKLPPHLEVLDWLLSDMSVDDLKTIIEYKVLDFNAPFLSTLFVKAHSEFYDKVIKGLKEPPSRAMICRTQVETSIGELLGSYYLKEVWTRKTAAEANLLVLKLETAFKTRLDSAEWLDDPTRANAQEKLSHLTHLLGGPKNPKTYPTLTFDPKAYIGNLNKVSAFDTTFNLALIDTAVDKHLWNKLALALNGYYQPPKNRIVFPAAYLQPPYFDAKADASANYGTIGVVIGHEISHGYDNRGRRYDGNGKKKPWWTETTWKQFNENSECFVEQYGSMDVKSELTGDFLGKLNGNLTLRETLADNGGVNTAYRAYRDYVHGEAETTKYTKEAGEKMFWIKYGQSWCEKNSDALLQALLNDVHPPGRHRLIGSVQNSVDFAKVFNCPVDSPMNPTKKCVMW